MILVRQQIAALFDQGIVTPAVKKLINPASFDIRIGNTIIREGGIVVDISTATEEAPARVAPKEFILADSLEVFVIPDYLAGQVLLKSSRAREGWNNCLALWLDPGWHGSVLTLELINENRFTSLPIYPGLRIAQVILHELAAIPDVTYAQTGRYNGDKAVQGSKG